MRAASDHLVIHAQGRIEQHDDFRAAADALYFPFRPAGPGQCKHGGEDRQYRRRAAKPFDPEAERIFRQPR